MLERWLWTGPRRNPARKKHGLAWSCGMQVDLTEKFENTRLISSSSIYENTRLKKDAGECGWKIHRNYITNMFFIRPVVKMVVGRPDQTRKSTARHEVMGRAGPGRVCAIFSFEKAQQGAARQNTVNIVKLGLDKTTTRHPEGMGPVLNFLARPGPARCTVGLAWPQQV